MCLLQAPTTPKDRLALLLRWNSGDGLDRRRVAGFTIIELLITLALISMIAAIAIPNFMSSIYQAKVRRAIGDIAAISAEINSFRNDNLFLPPDLDALDMQIPLDPFGKPYIYTPFIKKNDSKKLGRHDKWINPVNSDYDLFSVGVNGLTHKQLDHTNSRDDIVRASDGAFIGLGAEF